MIKEWGYMEKSEKILILSSVILVGFLFTIVCHYVLNVYFSFPDNFWGNFIWPVHGKFINFIDTMTIIQNSTISQITENWPNYNPLAAIFLLPFARSGNFFFSYFIFALIFLSWFLYSNMHHFQCSDLIPMQNLQNIFVLTFLSYPALMVLDLGNASIISFIFFAAFILLFQKEKYMTSGFILAILGALAPLSCLFSLMFLFKRKFKEFFLTIAMLLLIIYDLSLLTSQSLDKIIFFKSLLGFSSPLDITNCELMTNISSLFAIFQLLFKQSIEMETLKSLYNYLSLFFVILISFFAWKEKTFWKQLMLFTLTFLLVPYFINDTALLFLFVPIWLFVNETKKTVFDLEYTCLFALLLLPKIFGNIINPLLMLIFISLIILEQFKIKYDKVDTNE